MLEDGVNVAYAISGAAIACTVGLAVYHELPPLQADAPNETVALKGAPEPPISHPVRTILIVASPIVAPVIIPAQTESEVVQNRSEYGLAVSEPRHKTRPRPKIEARAGADVCARHGGQRVDDPARRSWHCVFSRRAK